MVINFLFIVKKCHKNNQISVWCAKSTKLTLWAQSSQYRLCRFGGIYCLITSFVNSLATIEPYEIKVHHLANIITVHYLKKKNVLYKKTRVMTSVISRSFFTAIDVILRFCETQSSNNETDKPFSSFNSSRIWWNWFW